jgi:hypothetical protein
MTLKELKSLNLKKNKGKSQVRVDLALESSIEETKDFYKSAKMTIDEL